MSGPTIDRAGSSGDIWTPQVFIEAVEGRFGPLSWDLACSSQNRKAPMGLTDYGGQDSLQVNWHELQVPPTRQLEGVTKVLCWLNPPFRAIAPWARKCAVEKKQGAEILLLVPLGAQNWYWDWVQPYADVYWVGRMVFDNCYNKRGELVTTNYPKDLILAHYWKGSPLVKGRPVRWRWQA